MFKRKPSIVPHTERDDLANAVQETMAVIWFAPDGTILSANPNFCATLDYPAEEIVGKHHSMFVLPDEVKTPEYQGFWKRLAGGEAISERFQRVAKGGRVIWINASYVPVRDTAGEIVKVVKFANDITERMRATAARDSKLAAVEGTQGVIEFDLKGNILFANANFCNVVGYSLDEIKGKHHSIFADPDFAKSQAYKDFWASLGRGEAQQGAFQRFGKGGREIWINASYNPILGADDKPRGVIKFCSDITAAKLKAIDHQGQIEALERSQAVISFTPDGTILEANENFLGAVGYAKDEIVGKHHRMFVDPVEAQSSDYTAFWASLGRGEYQAAEYKRFGKGGKEVWIQATYNPIVNDHGKVVKVVKFATDITARKHAIAALSDAISELSQNNLAVRITEAVPKDFEALKAGFNSSVSALGQVIGGISSQSSLILGEVSQIASAASDLSRRTEQQATALEETAAALDQIMSSVETVTQSTETTTQTTNQAQNSTREGIEKAERAASAMNEIATSSEAVRKITAVIDDIAFQTNLLALNAGVEAARAGESGRGFAVVAAEVRQLAQRSSDSSREIAELINTTSDQVQGGVKLVEDSREALNNIGEFVEQIRTQVAGLAAAAAEQSVGLKEINTAANQLDQTTQQNVAMFEETTAATQALNNAAEQLDRATSQFRVSSDESHQDALWHAEAHGSGQAQTG